MIRNARFHRWRHAERLVHAGEVVIHEIECHVAAWVVSSFPPVDGEFQNAAEICDSPYTGRASPIAKVSSPEPLKRDSIGSDDVRADRLSRGNQPGVVLAHPPRCTTLQECAPPRLRQMQSLNREPLQRRQGGGLVGRSLQQLRDGDNRQHERTPAQRGQEASGRAQLALGGVPLQIDQKRRVGLELPIVALIPGLGNVAWRPASDLR